MKNTHSQQSAKIAIIGGGNMANAMLSGLITGKNAQIVPENIKVWENNFEKSQKLTQEFKVQTAQKLDYSITQFDMIILAVKPQDIKEVCAFLCDKVDKSIIFSIAAGVLLKSLTNWLSHTANKQLKIVRAMPNTAAAVGKAVSGAFAQNCLPEDILFAELILSAMGEFIWLNNEEEMHALTAISGSGPAYFYYFCECLTNAGVALGLTPQVATKLALQTFLGSAELAHLSGEGVAELRQKVTSKGGTTEQAILTFEKQLPELVNAATQAAKNQSEKLAKN